MYDADEIRESLSTETVKDLLNKLGAENIIDETEGKGQLITNTICHNEHGGSEKLYYLEDRKYFHCFTQCDAVSIFDIVMARHEMKGISIPFSEAVAWVAIETGQGFGATATISSEVTEELRWLDQFIEKEAVVEDKPPRFYSEHILQVFANHGGHPAFTEDNISTEAMDRFSIRFDWGDNAIIIPHRYYKNGKIMGVMSRNLNSHAIEAGFKYVPTRVQNMQLSHHKHTNLFGLWENKETIKHLRKVAIFESEKSVLQCDSYYGAENNFSVALGGKFISEEQINILIELGIEEVILNFDKDFNDINSVEAERVYEHIQKVGKKLSPYMRVYSTFDRYDLLEENDSPSDKGLGVLTHLFNNKEEIKNETLSTLRK